MHRERLHIANWRILDGRRTQPDSWRTDCPRAVRLIKAIKEKARCLTSHTAMDYSTRMTSKRRVKDTEARNIQDVPVGTYLRIRRGDGFTAKVYQAGKAWREGGWGPSRLRREREYYVNEVGTLPRGRWLKTDTIVQVGFIASGTTYHWWSNDPFSV